jgi:phosphoserine aminotransferase
MNVANRLNFSGGPGALPEVVLEQTQQAIAEVPGVGLSILGISHRSDWFIAMVAELEQNLRSLLNIGPDYHIIFMQGGATQQFSMIAMNWLKRSAVPAEYLNTGYWSSKALADARRIGDIRLLWDGAEHGFNRLPQQHELEFAEDAAYFHYISNETVEGLQFHYVPGRADVPRICDMSSDFLSQPFDINQYALVYAHAQKNLGPAGVTVVVVRDDLVRSAPDRMPGFLDYRTQIQAHSNYNTPPVFAIYVVYLVTQWLLNEIGGLQNMDSLNRRKAELLYGILDDYPDFFRCKAALRDRSRMNVVFNLPNAELEQQFLRESAAAGFSGLAGHRSVGGIRASLYNGMSYQAVEELVGFMQQYCRK